MRAKIIIGIIAVIGAIWYLTYTWGEVQRIDQERQTERQLRPTAGITLYIEEQIEEAYSEAKYSGAEPVGISEVRTIPEYQISDSDATILETLAMAEAEGEGIEGKALVILVVMNRVQDPRFPDTIEEVVFQDRQFSTVEKGGRFWNMTADGECEEALRLIQNGWDESGGGFIF